MMKLVYEGTFPSRQDAMDKWDEIAKEARATKGNLKGFKDGSCHIKIYERARPKARKTRPRAWVERKCPNCGWELAWQDYLKMHKGMPCKVVRRGIPYDHRGIHYTGVEFSSWNRAGLQKVWNDSRVQLYCCKCYKIMNG